MFHIHLSLVRDKPEMQTKGLKEIRIEKYVSRDIANFMPFSEFLRLENLFMKNISAGEKVSHLN
jgi:hypothetical protein